MQAHLRVVQEGGAVVETAAGAVQADALGSRRPAAELTLLTPRLREREEGGIDQLAHGDVREVGDEVVERHPAAGQV